MAAGALAFGLLLAIGMLEVVPRLAPGLMPKKIQAVMRIYDARNSWESMMRGDRDLGFVLRPGLDLSFPSEGRHIAIRTQALSQGPADIGFRDLGIPGPYEAIALGDSFTFCDDAPAETCWVKRLSSDLGMRIASLGVNGYSNLGEARMLKKVAPSMPGVKLVLVGFFANDFKDNLHFRNWTDSGTDDYWLWQRRNRRSDASETLADWSITYRLIDAAHRYGGRGAMEHHDDKLDFVFTADTWWNSILEQPGQTPGFHLAEQAFDDMQQTARQMNAKLVVLLFPFKEQVYWSAIRHVYADDKQLANVDEKDIDASYVALKKSLDARGISTCDLTQPFRRQAERRGQLYLRAGAHWTDEGHAAAAESIEECLKEVGGLENTGAAAVAAAAHP